MKVHRAYRYELDPNAEQRILLAAKHAGTACFTYNVGQCRRSASKFKKTLKNYFHGLKVGRKVGNPKFRRKHDRQDSFRLDNSSGRFGSFSMKTIGAIPERRGTSYFLGSAPCARKRSPITGRKAVPCARISRKAASFTPP
ncbi:helix-turn-helix domain-containing protein [Brockia lithotrophica]|uniref:helix-turn-helix domain-containing protein n=1 Tax=Brockia lithotrophica TaxID=933949 RepID=UPI001B87C7AA|nr:helix-turn-helix domain-containing protein [Brockia lithotrophica]